MQGYILAAKTDLKLLQLCKAEHEILYSALCLCSFSLPRLEHLATRRVHTLTSHTRIHTHTCNSHKAMTHLWRAGRSSRVTAKHAKVPTLFPVGTRHRVWAVFFPTQKAQLPA